MYAYLDRRDVECVRSIREPRGGGKMTDEARLQACLECAYDNGEMAIWIFLFVSVWEEKLKFVRRHDARVETGNCGLISV